MKTSSTKLTRLGISDCLLAAAIYFLALANSTFAVVILTGYVLMFEPNRWLRMSAIKALAVLLLFVLVFAVVGVLPTGLGMLRNLLNIFDESPIRFFSAVDRIFSIITSALGLIQMLLFLLLGFKALKHETIVLGQIDELIAKHMPKEKDPTAQG